MLHTCDNRSREPWYRRYVLWAGVVAAVVAVYVPVRLVASVTNTVQYAGSGGFVNPVAPFVWPAYEFVWMLAVFFAASYLRIPLVLRLAAVLAWAAWGDYSAAIDGLLGLHDEGRLGFTLTSGRLDDVNSTILSQRMCYVAAVLGLVVGWVVGYLLRRAERRPEDQEPAGVQ